MTKIYDIDFASGELRSIVQTFPSDPNLVSEFWLKGEALKIRDTASREELIEQAATFEAAHRQALDEGYPEEAILRQLLADSLVEVEEQDHDAVRELANQKLGIEPDIAS